MIEIYLRQLKVIDAYVSYKWRNNPEIWKFTGSKPNKIITPENELEWIKKVLKKKTEKRFAICISGSDEYIGNIQLTGINNHEAEFHIFIGNTNYWGKGIGKAATVEMIKFAFKELYLKSIYLFVNEMNLPAVKIYNDLGFKVEGKSKEMLRMKISNSL